MKDWINSIIDWLQGIPHLIPLIIAATVLFGAWLIYLITDRFLKKIARTAVTKTKVDWDDYLYDHGFFERLSLLVPLIFVYVLAPQIPEYQDLIRKISVAIMIIFGARIISLFAEALLISFQKKQGKGRSLSGLIQAGKLVIYIIAVLLVVATVMEKSPLALLSGIGAMTAILTLVFKDTILSLVAGVQFSLNKTLKVGDWIEVPQAGADGDVVDLTLHNVVVQNWDKTLVSIPTHKFLEMGFKNWKGMSDAGGRRIKRSIRIDLQSVSFLNSEKIEELKKIHLIQDYLDSKTSEIEEENQKKQVDISLPVNGRAITNIGTFRTYAEAYIRSLDVIRKDMTLMVRQMEPGEQGVAIQVYCFTADTAWARYESIQADIFDHLMAAIPWFGLRLFQNPSGGDIAALNSTKK